MRLRGRHIGYYCFALGVGTLIFLGIVWGPALSLWLTLVSAAPSLSVALDVSVRLFGLALTDAGSLLTAFYLALSLLVGTDVALLIFYFKKYRAVPAAGAASGAFAAFIAALGFGCAACGTLFLSLLATSLGGAGLVLIPIEESIVWVLRGAGLALLTFSLYRLIKHVNSPLVCPVE